MTQFTAVLLLLQASAVCFLASGAVFRDIRSEETEVACGRRPITGPKARVSNGETPTYGEFPWQAGIRISTINTNRHYCGGIVISEYWILSAAHCFDIPKSDLDPQLFVVDVGDHNTAVGEVREQRFQVERVIKHPQYKLLGGIVPDYDIALLKLKPVQGNGIHFDDYVQPACLPEADTPYTEGKMCHISGWGATVPGTGTSSEVLQAAEVPLVSDAQCRQKLMPYGKYLTPGMVCAGPVKDGGGVCKGDSGGPLVCEEEGVYTVMGVTSWGWPFCRKPELPAVFAKVAFFTAWINKEMKD